ncbi:hypothetical protein LUZ60_014220 [Juncus effusus]|nr:hypothetical protein LUZ60_014220 [Juncus effusus]
MLRKKFNENSFQLDESYPRVSYAELVKATEGFANNNLVGAGRYGSVYKGILPLKNNQNSLEENNVVAIKVFNLKQLGSFKSFLAECESLSRTRHRNLIHIITCCSTLDYKGNDFKALVLDFMPNGSLDKWLYPKVEERKPSLSLIQRLNIAIDVADALDYLHNNCEPPLAHCDLKPSNILLKEDMSALVGDFGLAKFLLHPTNKQSVDSRSSTGIRGTIGYAAPEYGAGGHTSTSGDVYSFDLLSSLFISLSNNQSQLALSMTRSRLACYIQINTT